MYSFGVVELLVVLVVAAAVISTSRVRVRTPNAWVIMFLVGGVVAFLEILTYTLVEGDPESLKNYINTPDVLFGIFLRAGTVWVILYALLRSPLQSASAAPGVLLAWTLAVFIVESPLHRAVLVGWRLATGVPEYFAEAYKSASFWYGHLVPSLFVFSNLFSAVVFVSITRRMGPSAISDSSRDPDGNLAFPLPWGGVPMSASVSDATRLLCAGACMSGSLRSRLLSWLKDPNRAVAPEPGIDLELVATICTHADKRQRKHWWLRFLVFLAAGVVSIVNPVLGLATLIVAGATLYFAKAYTERYSYAPAFKKQVFDPKEVRARFAAELDAAVASGLPQAGQNLVVYSGWTPFVGAGADLGGWSFNVATNKPQPSLTTQGEPHPFTAAELYSAVESSLADLRFDGLEVQDYYFVNGADIRDDKDVLPDRYDRPLQSLARDRAAHYEVACDPRIRHYKWIRVRDWGNELVMSFLLRCTLRGDNLFVEIRRYLLTPIAEQYRTVDTLLPPRGPEIVSLLVQAAVAGPLLCAVSPFVAYGRVMEGVAVLLNTNERARRKLINRNLLYDYGTSASVRQMFATDKFLHYFQKIDGDFYIKVLEHAILDEIVTFLDEHNIDTSEIKERSTTILNSGIIVQGGDVKAASLAVGVGAQARNVQGEGARNIRRTLTKKVGA